MKLLIMNMFGKREQYFSEVKDFINKQLDPNDPLIILILLAVKSISDISDEVLEAIDIGEILLLVFSFLGNLDCFIVNHFLY